MMRTDLPFQLDYPRAWRTYLGGARLDELHGVQRGMGRDGHFPEEWIMSVVAARNSGREDFPEEGLSHLAQTPRITLKSVLESDPAAYVGSTHAAAHGAHPGVLVKLIDSSERLTIQVHPDRETAQRLLGSSFGKTECWHILDGRMVEGEAPCVYLGFREGVTREYWQELFKKQEIPGMLDCVHRYEVHPGETILIEGGVPHAIGAGCFLAEIQEPTDYTIRVERTTPSGFAVADEMCHQGLGFNQMFECFHYQGFSRDAARKKWFLPRRPFPGEQTGDSAQLVGYEDTPFFAMRELRTDGELKVKNERFSGLYVLEGAGTLECKGGILQLNAPGQYFVPAGTSDFVLRAAPAGQLRVLQCFGPRD